MRVEIIFFRSEILSVPGGKRDSFAALKIVAMQLNYKAYGTGPPLIILHGLFGSLDNWHTLARKLSVNYQVYIIDQRNHGKSPHTPEMDYPAMARDVIGFMDELGLDQVTIAGHSMGGKTAMEVALSHPERISRLVSIDMTPFALSGGHQALFEAMKALDLTAIERRKGADEALKGYIADFGIRQFLLKNLERSPEGGFQWKMNLPAIEASYPAIMAGVNHDRTYDGPTLFVKGGQSDYLQAEALSAYQEIFPQATLEVITGVGHWVHAEAPDAFKEVLERFLQQN